MLTNKYSYVIISTIRIENISTIPKKFSLAFLQSVPSPHSSPSPTIDLLSIPVVLPFLEFRRYVISMFLRVIHVVESISSSFLLLPDSICLYRYVTFCLSLHPSIDIWVVSSSLLLWTKPWIFKSSSECFHFSWVDT